MERVIPIIGKKKIASRIRQLARRIAKDYNGEKSITLLVVLKGSLIFAADLLRELPQHFDIRLETVSIQTYLGQKRAKAAKAPFIPDTLKGQRVLIVEDIVDTGHTAKDLIAALRKKGVKSPKLCSLLSKPSRREVLVKINYLGFEIPDRFVVGYGLDLDGRFRHLSDICVYHS